MTANHSPGVRLYAAFAEWMMGWPIGWVTDVKGLLCGDQLSICGNGVVPQQAYAALASLMQIGDAA